MIEVTSWDTQTDAWARNFGEAEIADMLSRNEARMALRDIARRRPRLSDDLDLRNLGYVPKRQGR